MREKIWLKRGFWLLCFLFLWLVFSLSAASFLDPDFGWHFKTGEWIWLHRSVPKTDLFSYTMPDYQWQDHSWLTELFLYSGFLKIGYSGLAVVFSFLTALAFMVWISSKKIVFALFPLFLVALSSFEYMAIRPQMVSFLLAAIIFGTLKISYKNPWWLLVTTAIFAFWVNLHGGFLIGLVLIYWAVVTDAYLCLKEKKPLEKHLVLSLITLVLALASTLANPYRLLIYKVIFTEMFSGQKAHMNISEWLPYSNFNVAMLIYTGFFLALCNLFRNKLSLFEKSVVLSILVAGFLSRRLLIYFYLFSLPPFVFLVEKLYSLMIVQERFLKIWRHRIKILLFFLVLIGVSFYWQLSSASGLSETNFFPAKAVKFLRTSQLAGNLFSVYNWGGYLIWQLPEKKVFVDGRMAIWRQNGYSAFEEELKIHSGKVDYRPIFEKYSISTVLLPAEKSAKKPLIELSRKFLAKFKKEKKEAALSLSERLLNDGWRRAYQDEIAQVLMKSSN